MANRLAQSQSPYLLQHKENPVDWWPWCDEAWNLAQREQKPVFLSVGYSSCHWCHVMAHESFEDPEVAEALNRSFVSIKLDREERPDIDEVYMTAVQLATGHGGWPMSVFLTPDRKPFFAGTYFPRESRGGHPGFLTVLASLSKAWAEQREDVVKSAEEFATGLSAALQRTLPTTIERLDVQVLDQAVDALHHDFDEEWGGFGGRPKFPPHSSFRFLLDYAQLRPEMGGDSGDLPDRAAHMALYTLERIALGGIHDHVGGGFHRYSTDERWLLPHFEKMLYDNAQLLGAFHHAATAVTDARLHRLFNDVADNTVRWVQSEMVVTGSVFASALDADSDGKEGAAYVWPLAALESVLGARATAFCQAYNCREEGNFLDEASGMPTGENVLHLGSDLGGDFAQDLARLRTERKKRVRPGLDFKALCAWNGLMIGSLARARAVDDALQCARTWVRALDGDGLPHMLTNGMPTGEPFLDDLAYMADGLLVLGEETGDPQWAQHASLIVDAMVRDYGDPAGGFFFTRNGDESVFGRSKPFMDGATPSANGIAARVLRRLGRTEESLATIWAGVGWIQHVPRAAETLLREVLWHLWESDDTSLQPIASNQRAPGVTVSLEPEEPRVGDDGWAFAEIVLTVPAGLHINSDDPLAKWLVPTTVRVEGVYGEAAFPEAHDGVFSGETRIAVRLRQKGEGTDFVLTVGYQVCSESECQAPSERALAGRLQGS